MMASRIPVSAGPRSEINWVPTSRFPSFDYALPQLDECGGEPVFQLDRRTGPRAGLGRRSRPRTIGEESLVGTHEVQVPTRGQGAAKRIFDVVFALALLAASFPLLLLVALLVKADGGPILYSQERVGRGGRKFKMWKFRSMVLDAEAQLRKLRTQNEVGGPAFKMRHDPRVTTVGRIIRKFSIDELPQLWNVLRGDMSVVGPRPVLAREVEGYRRWQLARFAVKPGLTCIWQVSGRSRIGFEEWMRMDIRYVETRSFACDLKLVARTVRVVALGDGAW